MEAQIAQMFSSIFETMKKDIVAQVEKDFEAKLAKAKAEIKEEIKAEIFGEFEIKVDARFVAKQPVAKALEQEIVNVVAIAEEEAEETEEMSDDELPGDFQSYEFHSGEWEQLENNEVAFAAFEKWYKIRPAETYKHEKHAYNSLCKHEEYLAIEIEPGKTLLKTAKRVDEF